MCFVIKRDGKEEKFDKNKLIKVLVAAGLKSPEASNVAETVHNWMHTINQRAIKSTDIGNKVVEEIKKVNTYVAGLYAWYEQTKNKT